MPAQAWIVVIAAAASVSLALGARQTFGLFLLPLGAEHAIPAFAYGAAVAEVAIDTLTGESRLLRADILQHLAHLNNRSSRARLPAMKVRTYL